MRELADIFRIREVAGVVASEAGPWPADANVVFQLFGPGTRPVLRKATIRRDGAFRVPNVPSGDYCFEASAVGWDPVFGRINVSRRNDRLARVSFSMPLGN
jgi:hypothetical protein